MTNRVAKQNRPVATNARNGGPCLTLPKPLRKRVAELCERYNINEPWLVAEAVKAAVHSCETDNDFLIATIKDSPAPGRRAAV